MPNAQMSKLSKPSPLASDGRSPTIWQGETPLLCCDTRQETHDVKSFFFTGGTDSIFSYKPGQFITLEVPVEDKTIARTYTISATPTRPYLISITVKRVPAASFPIICMTGWSRARSSTPLPPAASSPFWIILVVTNFSFFPAAAV